MKIKEKIEIDISVQLLADCYTIFAAEKKDSIPMELSFPCAQKKLTQCETLPFRRKRAILGLWAKHYRKTDKFDWQVRKNTKDEYNIKGN